MIQGMTRERPVLDQPIKQQGSHYTFLQEVYGANATPAGRRESLAP